MTARTKNQYRKRDKIVRKILAEEFPACFAPAGAEKRPLAVSVGPMLQMMKPEIGRHALATALEDYCGGPTYLRHCVAGAPRINLQGEIEGVVSVGQAEFAANKMKMFPEPHKDERTSA